jgi:hypothetical protein
VRSMLEGQLETARRDLRSAQHSIARLEGDMVAAADTAASRETSLNTQVSCLWCPPLPHTHTHMLFQTQQWTLHSLAANSAE